MAPLLALGASVLFGAGDFLGGLASRRAPVVLVLVSSQLVGLIGVSTWLVLSNDPVPPRGDLLAAIGAGLAGCIGLAALYTGLSIGAMAIVAPVSAVSPIVPLLADLAQGKQPEAIQLAGMVVAAVGVVVLSRQPGGGTTRIAAGIGVALVAALGFGLFELGIDAASDESVPWATTTTRLSSCVLALGAALVLRPAVGSIRGVLPLVLAVGVFDTSANVLVALASTRELISIVATLSALYPVTTVLLAVALLGERPKRSQVAGGALALSGATLIAV